MDLVQALHKLHLGSQPLAASDCELSLGAHDHCFFNDIAQSLLQRSRRAGIASICVCLLSDLV